jgi:hypothetical protein
MCNHDHNGEERRYFNAFVAVSDSDEQPMMSVISVL